MSISIPGADFTPQLTGYTGQGAFRFWCQKVLPIVYDDSLSYYELLNKVVAYLNNVIKDVGNTEANVQSLLEAYTFLQDHVNNSFNTVEGAFNGLETDVNNMIEYVDNFFNELIIKEARSLNSKTVNPIYIGDFLMTNSYYLGACIKIGNSYYVIMLNSHAEENQSDMGVVRKFTLYPDVVEGETTIPGVNEEETSFAHEIKVGHANSMCYVPDTDMIYVAPVFTYEHYNPENGRYYDTAPWLYCYKSEEFVYYGKLNTPTYAMGVSYDHVTKTLYYFDYNRNIYRYVNDEWELYCSVDYSNVPTYDYFQRSYNQDFAVYNNIAYISSPYGNIIYGILKPVSTSILGGLVVDTLDTSARWRLGELEGMEFNEKGHLFAVDLVGLTSYAYNGFVLEVPVGVAPPNFSNVGGSFFGVHDGTMTLSEKTQKQFALRTYQIRSLQQLVALTLSGETSRVDIPSDSKVIDEANNVRITQDVQLYVRGEYEVNAIDVLSGMLDIASNNDTHKITFRKSSGPIYVDRAGSLKFSGRYALRISMPNATEDTPLLVDPSYSFPSAIFRFAPVDADGDKNYRIGSNRIASGSYVGTTNVMSYVTGEDIYAGDSGAFPGYINASNNSLRFSIPLAKGAPNTNVTILTLVPIKIFTPTGTNIISGSNELNLTSSDYTVKAYRSFGSGIRFIVDLTNGATFNTGLANTCVTVSPLGNFRVQF